MSISYTSIGFIGLGNMGYPMVENMVKKLPSSVKIYVFDVSEQAVKKISSEHKERVFPCSNSKEVARKSVRPL